MLEDISQPLIVESRRQVPHFGFSDESTWNEKRYRSIGLLTLRAEHAGRISLAAEQALSASNMDALSWKDLRTKNTLRAGKSLLGLVARLAKGGWLRIDVLVWDTHDTRHRVLRRDDTENLARMYYHLMENTTRQRWPDSAHWVMNVDSRADIDWTVLQDCLNGKSRWEKANMRVQQSHFDLSNISTRQGIQVVQDDGHVLIQIADLFAGLAAFSWNQREAHSHWLSENGSQRMFGELRTNRHISSSSSYKHQIALEFHKLNSLEGLNVSHNPNAGFKTFNPSNRINFWHYSPQHQSDKAPTKT